MTSEAEVPKKTNLSTSWINKVKGLSKSVVSANVKEKKNDGQPWKKTETNVGKPKKPQQAKVSNLSVDKKPRILASASALPDKTSQATTSSRKSLSLQPNSRPHGT
jgi:hypothetical protein